MPRSRICNLGLTDYVTTMNRMLAHTTTRTATTADAIWLTYHNAIYTLGQAGKEKHLLRDNGIALIRSNRGGQITYHGPGQVVAYVLYDLHRAGFGIRTLVHKLEQALLDVLATYEISAARIAKRPGIYVGTAKIGAIGLRVSRGCTYHGCSLNVDCDLAPFDDINTCGYPDLSDTSMQMQGCQVCAAQVATQLGEILASHLS